MFKGGNWKVRKDIQKLILRISVWTVDVSKNQIITFTEAKQGCFVWSGNSSTEIVFLRVNQFFSRETDHPKGKGDKHPWKSCVASYRVMHSSVTFRIFMCAIPYSVLPRCTKRFFFSNRIMKMFTQRRNVIFNGSKMIIIKHFLPCCKFAQCHY